MAEDSTATIRAMFETRDAADIAVEHLVQQHGISRPDIFIQSASYQKTTGTHSSRGDVARSDAPREARWLRPPMPIQRTTISSWA